MFLFNKFPGDTDAAGSGTALRGSLVKGDLDLPRKEIN